MTVYLIPKSSLEKAAESIKEYVCISDNDKQTGNRTLRSGELADSEISLTAWVCRVFDRFLFPNAKQGYCAHHAPVGKSRSGKYMYPTDLYVTRVTEWCIATR